MKNVRISDLHELERFAQNLASTLRGGETIGLVGDLGAGKTTFVQLLAAALGVHDAVKSPTFILMQLFETGAAAKRRGVRRLCHVDAYRFKDQSELDAIGFDEYAREPGTVAVVEWADRVPRIHALPGYREITFDFGDGEERILRIE